MAPPEGEPRRRAAALDAAVDHAPEIELAAARPHPAAAGQAIAHAGGEPLAEILDLRELLRIGDVPEIDLAERLPPTGAGAARSIARPCGQRPASGPRARRSGGPKRSSISGPVRRGLAPPGQGLGEPDRPAHAAPQPPGVEQLIDRTPSSVLEQQSRAPQAQARLRRPSRGRSRAAGAARRRPRRGQPESRCPAAAGRSPWPAWRAGYRGRWPAPPSGDLRDQARDHLGRQAC